MKYDNIYITGKSGTVGSNIDFGYGSTHRYDLTDKGQTKTLISVLKPDAIIHCAAKVGGLKMHLENQYELFYQNILINTNVLEMAKRYKVPRVLSLSSSCVFSDKSPPPYNESMVHDHEPFEAHYSYGHTKRLLDVHSKLCYREGLVYNTVIPTNIYGINDDFNFDSGHVVGVLIHKAYLAKKNKEEFVVWGDGEQRRQFLFTADVAKLLEWALENYLEEEPLILSNNTLVSVGEIAEIIAERFDVKIVFDTSQPTGQVSRDLSGNKLRGLIDFEFTPMENGLNQTIDWFLNNIEEGKVRI